MDRIARELMAVAREITASTPLDKLAKIISKHWMGMWKVTIDDNLVNIKLSEKPVNTRGVRGDPVEYKRIKREYLNAVRGIENDSKRNFDIEDSNSTINSVFLVSDDFLGSKVRTLTEKRDRRDF